MLGASNWSAVINQEITCSCISGVSKVKRLFFNFWRSFLCFETFCFVWNGGYCLYAHKRIVVVPQCRVAFFTDIKKKIDIFYWIDISISSLDNFCVCIVTKYIVYFGVFIADLLRRRSEFVLPSFYVRWIGSGYFVSVIVPLVPVMYDSVVVVRCCKH